MGKELTLLAVGDVCIGGRGEILLPMQERVWNDKSDWNYWMEKVAPLFQEADFSICNCEAAICEGGDPVLEKVGTGGGCLKMPPGVADAMKKAGFDAVALANNHGMDYGVDGLLQTLDNLKRVGIEPIGAGRNIKEARAATLLKYEGVTLGLLSYSSVFVPGIFTASENKPGIATVTINTSYEVPRGTMHAPGGVARVITYPAKGEREKMEEDIRLARGQADIVVINWHWGLTRWAQANASGLSIDEAPFFVINYQEDMGRAAVDAGADLVIGHHPHRLQGIELYKGKLICYSTGILTMPFRMGPNLGEESVIIKGYIDKETKRFSKVTIVPVMVPPDTMQPYALPIGKSGDLVVLLNKISRKYGTKFSIQGNEIAISK